MFPETANWLSSADEWVLFTLLLYNRVTVPDAQSQNHPRWHKRHHLRHLISDVFT